MKPIRQLLVLVTLLLSVATTTAFAQTENGSLYGEVVDQQGEALPGVTVTLDGMVERVAVTDAEGKFRFVSLPPGTYQLMATLEGFSTVKDSAVRVVVGRITTVVLTMTPSVEQPITVTSSSPVLDDH